MPCVYSGYGKLALLNGQGCVSRGGHRDGAVSEGDCRQSRRDGGAQRMMSSSLCTVRSGSTSAEGSAAREAAIASSSDVDVCADRTASRGEGGGAQRSVSP